jgi:hypothetical protein
MHSIGSGASSLFITWVAAILLFTTNNCSAGSPAGPYLVWANLHENTKSEITTKIKAFTQTQENGSFCEEHAAEWIMYIKKRPKGMSNELLAKAIDQNDDTAKQLIKRNLLSFREQPIDNGLDGIIAYSEHNKPHMISIDAHGKIKRSKTIRDINSPHEISTAFCSVMPEIYRR